MGRRRIGLTLDDGGLELEGIVTNGEDSILELGVTPIVAMSCPSWGFAREVAALTGEPIPLPALHPRHRSLPGYFPRTVDDPEACPTCLRPSNFAASTIKRSLPPGSPRGLQSADVRSVTPDRPMSRTTCLLELGQPMHAYDLATLQGENPRGAARALQNGYTSRRAPPSIFSEDMLVIADRGGAVGLAGNHGRGAHAKSHTTRIVFLEVAFFAPSAIQGRGRRVRTANGCKQHV